MGVFSVRAERVEDVQRQLTVHSVGDKTSWVGPNDAHYYRPRSEASFDAEGVDSRVIGRFAFSLDKSIVALRRVPESTLGQAAILSTDQENGHSIYMLIPVKLSRLSPTTEELIVAKIEGETQDPAQLEATIASAILHVVQRTSS